MWSVECGIDEGPFDGPTSRVGESGLSDGDLAASVPSSIVDAMSD